MRIITTSDALSAAVAASVVLRAGAFVSVTPAPLAPTSSLSMRSATCRQLLRTSAHQVSLRREESPRRSRQTRLSAQADSIYPDGVPNLPGIKTVVETEEEEELRAVREWKDDGRKGRVLLRRKEIPSPEMDPASVCQLILQSLQNNDDPMLDYGAAVAIKFASSKNAIRGMTPAEYGTFLRNDPDQMLLIDNASCAPAERAKVSPDGKRILQKVEVVGRYPDDVRRIVDVQLTKEEDGCWRVDAMTVGPVNEKRK